MEANGLAFGLEGPAAAGETTPCMWRVLVALICESRE